MTNENISKFISNLNLNKKNNFLSIKNIGGQIYLAQCFLDKNPQIIYSIFFIKNIDDKYAGAVLDMGEDDLHWFVRPKDRGKRLLSVALKDYILPYIFSSGRKIQNVTIGDFTLNDSISRRVAINAGFLQDENEYYKFIKKSD